MPAGSRSASIRSARLTPGVCEAAPLVIVPEMAGLRVDGHIAVV